MTDAEIHHLIDEIDSAGLDQLSRDGSFFERVERVREVRSSTLLHHSLSNKKARSAHFLRCAIRRNDGPELHSLWSFIDGENEAQAVVERMDDYTYLPWAATFIMGEIGGVQTFAATVARLTFQHQSRYHLLVRLLSHIVIRYLQIAQPEEPTATMLDLKTGESRTVPLRDLGGGDYEREMKKRSQADECFTLLSPGTVTDAKLRLQLIPDSHFIRRNPLRPCLKKPHSLPPENRNSLTLSGRRPSPPVRPMDTFGIISG